MCQRRSRDAPEDHKQGRGPSRVARAPPIAVRPARSSRRCCDARRAHQVRSVVTDWRNACKRRALSAPRPNASRRRYAPARERVVRDAIASLAALAAADALAGAGRALRRRTSRTRIGVLRVLAAAAATSAAIGTASISGVQRAIPVLGAATRAARTRPVGRRTARQTPATTTRATTRAAGTRT